MRINNKQMEVKGCEVYCSIEKFIEIMGQYKGVKFDENC